MSFVYELPYAGWVQIFRDLPHYNKAFGNLFCNPQKSFQTSPESSESNKRGCQPFFKLNNNTRKKLLLDVNFFVNAIVEFEEWLTASIFRVGEVWKLFCGLQNKIRKALLFITKDLNWPAVCNGRVSGCCHIEFGSTYLLWGDANPKHFGLYWVYSIYLG